MAMFLVAGELSDAAITDLLIGARCTRLRELAVPEQDASEAIALQIVQSERVLFAGAKVTVDGSLKAGTWRAFVV